MQQKRIGTILKHKKTRLEGGQTCITAIYGHISMMASPSLHHILRFVTYPSIEVTRLGCVARSSVLGLFRIIDYVTVFKNRISACRKNLLHKLTRCNFANIYCLRHEWPVVLLLQALQHFEACGANTACVGTECIRKQGPYGRGQTPYQQGH